TINFIFIVDQVAVQIETADAALQTGVEFAVFPNDGSIHEFDFANIKVSFLLEVCPIADPEIHAAIEEVPLDAEAILIPGAAGNTVEKFTGPHSLITDADFPVALLICSHCRRTKKQRSHYGAGDAQGPVTICDAPVSPWRLLEGAVAVYTVSSQLGFEAILAGHRPRVFGQPFYAGWGLTADENPVARRQRRLTRVQLFAGAMILAPVWHDPCRDRLCSFEEAVDQLEAEVRVWREDRAGHVAVGMRAWKRGHLRRAFGRERALVFQNDPSRAVARARAEGRGLLVWAGADSEGLRDLAGSLPLVRVEDGFLRSRGLGAALVPPLSLVADATGIHYDPGHASDLERLIAAGPPPGGEARAERLVARIRRAGLTKYNLDAAPLPELPQGYRILVPGQVEDDASVRFGAGAERTNLALLARVRAENPQAVILYKPHPDVEAGLRAGAVPEAEALRFADHLVAGCGTADLIEAVDAVWTITSGLGFEALLRGKPVTCLGMPFYAGWGLTRDLIAAPARRRARPSLAGLAHAVLIGYPRHVDPVSGLPCPPEVVVERLIRREGTAPRRGARLLARVQGVLAGQAWLWR
ncbi:MAG: hypothetical protein CVT83_05230, partial [Alphaproteobacteria bacterium HGW-Alphaproteobacteria-5]